MSKGIIASLDPPWISEKDLNYAYLLIKASLLFYDKLIIDDSQLIDSNQMRYLIKQSPDLFKNDPSSKLIIISRKRSIDELLLEVVNRKPPMIFSSLDFEGNQELLESSSNSEKDLKFLYEIFRKCDMRRSLSTVIEDYESYINKLSRFLPLNNLVNLNENLFRNNFMAVVQKFHLGTEFNFRTRTEVYNFISSVRGINFVEAEKFRKGIKALADIIYILNKAYYIEDSTVHFIFDSKHINEINQDLNGIGIGLNDILSLYEKEIKIIKLKIDSILFDTDVNFFIENLLPLEVLFKENRDIFREIEEHLDQNREFDKLSFLKFIRKRDKYSRLLERKFPRFRAIAEITIFAFILIDFGSQILSAKITNIGDFFLLILGVITTFDGSLGLVEYLSSKRLGTDFYKRIKKWYEINKTDIIENKYSSN